MNDRLLSLYLITAVLLTITPGPDMLFILGTGARGGPRIGVLAACGVATSESLHITLAAVGLSALFAAAPAAFTAVRIAGAGYLLVLGIRMFFARADLHSVPHPGGGAVSPKRAYLRGALSNLLNPKMITFSAAFLPQFVDHRLGHVGLQFLVLGAIFICIDLLVGGLVGVLAGRAGTWLMSRHGATRTLHTAIGGLFVGLSAWLVVDR